MKLWMNLLTQSLGFAAQVALPMFVKDPAHYATAAGVVAAAQGAAGLVAHTYNPDGTKASTTRQGAE